MVEDQIVKLTCNSCGTVRQVEPSASEGEEALPLGWRKLHRTDNGWHKKDGIYCSKECEDRAVPRRYQ